jgi:ERCC4-type nuclease
VGHCTRMALRIVADIHERASGVPRLLVESGVDVEVGSLPTGDYQLTPVAVAERKTVRGLHAAIIDGSFWPQVGRLRDVARFPYLMIEGPNLDDGPLAPAAIRGACIALLDLGVAVVRSTGADDSALWLHRLAVRRSEVRYRSTPAYAQRPKREAGFPAAEAALACVPGMSRVCAQALLSRFGSLAAIVHAEGTEIESVRGIGPMRAAALRTTFHARYTTSHSRSRRD